MCPENWTNEYIQIYPYQNLISNKYLNIFADKYPYKYMDQLYSNIFVTHCTRHTEDHTKKNSGNPPDQMGTLQTIGDPQINKMARCTTRWFGGTRIVSAAKSGRGRPQNEPPPPPQDTNFAFWQFLPAGWFQMDWSGAVWAGRSIGTLWTPYMPIFGTE